MIFLALIISCFSFGKSVDFFAPSQNPPRGLLPEQIPQFVVLSFDDNHRPWAVDWLVQELKKYQHSDGTPIRAVFFNTGKALSESQNIGAWIRAFDAGHEIGNHTMNHLEGETLSSTQWHDEIVSFSARLASPRPQGMGVSVSEIKGFRAPFLQYTDDALRELVQNNIVYDSSIEEGWAENQDGSNFFWPYTLDKGSPGHDYLVRSGAKKNAIVSAPGVWEIPIHVMMIPDDQDCLRFGIPVGLRDRLVRNHEWIKRTGYKVTGVDWNLLYFFSFTPEEYLGVLKYNLNKRIHTNRAPFNFAMHSQYYDTPERQMVFSKFIEYALSFPQVRFVTPVRMIEWLTKQKRMESMENERRLFGR